MPSLPYEYADAPRNRSFRVPLHQNRSGGVTMATKASRSRALLLALLVLALTPSCRRAADDQPVVPPDQLFNTINEIREEKKEAPPGPPKRLAFLTPRDLATIS